MDDGSSAPWYLIAWFNLNEMCQSHSTICECAKSVEMSSKFNWTKCHFKSISICLAHPQAISIDFVLFTNFSHRSHNFMMTCHVMEMDRKGGAKTVNVAKNFVFCFHRCYFGWIIGVDCTHNYCCHQLPCQFLYGKCSPHANSLRCKNLCLNWICACFDFHCVNKWLRTLWCVVIFTRLPALYLLASISSTFFRPEFHIHSILIIFHLIYPINDNEWVI